MDPVEKFQRRGAAQRRMRAQRRRAGLLRNRVVAISLICFVLLWAVVFAQMATGNDPVLGSGSGHAASSRQSGSKGGTESSGAAGEALETPEPEYEESEYAEPEYEESEYAEPEYEYAEPAPLTTGQS